MSRSLRSRLTRPTALAGLALAVLLTACELPAGRSDAPAQVAARSSAASTETSAPPRLRLPRSVVPESHKVRLRLDPAQETFSGRIEISARVVEPTQVVWLNARDLRIERAALVVERKSVPAEVIAEHADFVGLRAAQPLPKGLLRIELDYTGNVANTETLGIFRQKQGANWYAFTQFESISARKAFPCFDEPDRKAPWQVTLEVPAGLTALSNTGVQSTEPGENGMQVVSFRPTPPLPSYLVAFAVGPFDLVPGGTTRNGTPIRVAVSRGRAGDVGYALETTPIVLARLEDYFGTPYPYEKLDLLGIPLTIGFGAMENPGLITFGERGLAAAPRDVTIGFQRGLANTLTHELAHQWFGDLVTLAWWDDIWLNEAFATWMAQRVVSAWKPEWDRGVGVVQRRAGALGNDVLQSVRSVRQPIESSDDILNAFDRITYDKGGAVIEMFERWVGPETFQRGVRAYLERHANGNATASDFLRAVGEAAGRDVLTPFSTFLDQPGAPLVRVALRCEAGQAPVLELAQERYRPRGASATTEQRWEIPVCAKYPAGKGTATECTLLDRARGELRLPQATGCPEWVLPNDGGTGYYRSALEGKLLTGLIERGMPKLTLPERVGAISDVRALVTAGQIDVGKALALVPRYARDENREIVNSVIGIAGSVRDWVPDELRTRYAAFLRKTFGARARALGWRPARGESEDTALLRSSLVELVSDEGEDRAFAAQARPLALRWLADRKAIDANMVGVVLGTAARYGDTALFERFYKAAQQTQDRRDRQRLLGALARFRGPKLVMRARALALGSEFDIRESSGLLRAGLGDPQTRRATYEALKADYDVIAPRMPNDMAAGLIGVGTAQCDAALRDDVAAFFAERTPKLAGGPRRYAQSLEAMDLCIAQRAAAAPALAEFLRTH